MLYLASDYILSGNPEATFSAANSGIIREDCWQFDMKRILRKQEIEAQNKLSPGQGKEKCDGRF